MEIRRVIILLCYFCVASISPFALDVAEDEIRTIRNTSVEFINYVGPHDRIDTIEQILGIGRSLADAGADARADARADSVARFAGKYEIAHLVDPEVASRLDADVLSFLPTAGVDHIDNVRRILAGYLERAYSYSLDDALLLARFITVYNAVYRSRVSYFTSNYKSIVLDYLDTDRVGISTAYRDWAGSTQLVIPLTDGASAGGIGSLDSDVLTETEVIEELRDQPDRGIPDRKEITELKEREVEVAQREIDQERDTLDQQRTEIEATQTEIDDERDRLSTERSNAEAREDDEEVAAIDQRERELNSEEATLDQQEDRIEEREEALEESDAAQSERIERIQAERATIVEEERALLEEQETDGETSGSAGILGASSAEQAILFLKTQVSNEVAFASFVYIRAESNEIVLESAVNTIRNRRYVDIDGTLYVVAGEVAENRDVRAMAVDSTTLELLGMSEVSIYPSSWIEPEESGTVLLVFDDSGVWRIGRFDSNLALLRSSSSEVSPDTHIRTTADMVIVQNNDEELIGLSSVDLDLLRNIE